MTKTLSIALLLFTASPIFAQPCPDVRTAEDKQAAALMAARCLGNPDPQVRDALAFEGLSSVMRAGALGPRTLAALKTELLAGLSRANESPLLTSFSALTLAEVARTDRITPWMTGAERQELVDAAAAFLSGISDYRAFSDREGFVHAVAHGADFALQLALNPATTKPQLATLLQAIALQVAPRDPAVAYWAGEPDRLARAVVFIAQRKLLTDDEWTAWFATVMDPKPIRSWGEAFKTEVGIRRHHNVRAFLLSVFAASATAEDAGVRQLISPTRDALKLVP